MHLYDALPARRLRGGLPTPRPRAPAGSARWGLGRQEPQVGGGQLAGGDQQQRELLQCPRPAQPGNAQAHVSVPDVLAPLGHRMGLPADPLSGVPGAGRCRGPGVPPVQVGLEPRGQDQPWRDTPRSRAGSTAEQAGARPNVNGSPGRTRQVCNPYITISTGPAHLLNVTLSSL
jgi:hypothetical protein